MPAVELLLPRYDRGVVRRHVGDGGHFAVVGQDVAVHARVHGCVDVIAVFDGHGAQGAAVARCAAECMWREWARCLPSAREAVAFFDQTDVAIEAACGGVFDTVARYVRSAQSGTTCVWAMHCPDARTMVAGNCGDSLAHIVPPDGEPIALSNSHNCDNHGECLLYFERMATLGVSPKTIVYGRSSWEVYRADETTGRMVLHDPHRGRIQEAYPVGVQTVHSDAPCYGNTLAGAVQLLRCFGDRAMTPHVVHTPHVGIHRYDVNSERGCALVVASDGMLDVLRPEEIAALGTAQEVVGRVVSLRRSDFDVHSNGMPVWDDATALVLKL